MANVPSLIPVGSQFTQRIVYMARFQLLSTLLVVFVGSNTGICGMVYTDRGAFESALGSFAIEDFESASLSGTVDGGAVASIGFADFTVNTSPNATKVLSSPAFGAINTTPGGQKYLYIDTDVGFSGFTVTFVLDAAQAAFGFDYATNNNPNNVNTISLDGQDFVVPTAIPNVASFWGYIAGVGDTFGTVSMTATTNSAFGFDQVTYGAATADVPEPGSLALIGIGVASLSMGAARRRRSGR
jgi:hypothetical protein